MGKKLVILGGGESGVGAALLAKSKGFNIFLSDKGIIKPKFLDELVKHDIPFEQEQHSEETILQADEIIKSPGIPESAEIIKKIRQKGIPVISEIEFAGRYSKAKMIGITGSNGKTTTTMLVHHIYTRAGLNVGLAGNVGVSLARQVAENDRDYYIIELSSFQLDDMFDFHVNTAILTNITPDHLDRYNYNFQNYIESKFRILRNQNTDDQFIYCIDDPVIMAELQKTSTPAKHLPFSINQIIDEGGYVQNENLCLTTNNETFIMSIQDLALQGKHNQYNSLAAGIAAQVNRIRKDVIRDCLMDFQAVEHRLEKFIKVHGIEFINDSKATNVNSTWYALESMKKPVVWIVGGIDKGNDYSQLFELIHSKVKAMIFLGANNAKLIETFKDFNIPKIESHNMRDAVKSSYYLAKKGDVVLLSPACASFDLFDSYEDRGRQFKKAVRDL